jgi:pimeloyl-ACP methyl ester carboxylesterase
MSGRLAGLWGEYDATAVPYLDERRRKLEEFRPGASFDIFPGVGHWVQYEAPEAFNTRLAELARSHT